ncbi:hypothetical protein QJQ45_022253 [Haematococcus lacustris]|nr:hypothetical protein QJQ45_022253 [Haematococcus lacustris]
MDALRALKAKLKKETSEASADKKFITKAELEAAKLLKLRAEEEEERKRKACHPLHAKLRSVPVPPSRACPVCVQELKRKGISDAVEAITAAKQARPNSSAQAELLLPALSKEEVIRRLRALGQPATLFAEEDVDRLKRLLKSEKEVTVEDENRGGQQENLLRELQKTEKERVKTRAKEAVALKAADGLASAAAAAIGRSTGAAAGSGGTGATGAVAEAGASTGSRAADDGGRKEAKWVQPVASCLAPVVPVDPKQAEQEALMEAFKRASSQVAEQREEATLCTEDRIAKSLRRWMKEWEEDLDRRPESVKATASGYQASLTFAQTAKYLEPLFERLKHRALHEELRAGLWMMVTGMRDRNYLYANDLYLRLAIGNAPWPIGVTSVGIHERSAREKISHVMNQSGQAHIMNDEATRKYLQAMKRLISVVQRMYPTDPSRSADFETTTDLGRGVAGAGSTKLALLAAEARGESTASLGLPSAPHFMDDNKVAVPQKWKHILAKAQGDITQAHSNNEKAVGEQQPAPVQ